MIEGNQNHNSTFHLWYRYNVSDNTLAMSDQRKVPFRLKWRVEAANQLKVTKSKLGESVYMPGWGKPFHEHWFQTDYVFKATLKVSDEIRDQVGNGSLIIRLEVDTNQEHGWVENVRYWRDEELSVSHEQSCEMSQIWKLNLCKNIERLG